LIRLECFFDCSSPWSYLGMHNLQPLARRLDIPVEWRPVLVGGVFNKVNSVVYANRANPPVPAKHAWTRKDMQDWARFSGIVINNPPACGHPVNSAICMRICLVLQESSDVRMIAFAMAAYEALWRDGRDLGHDDVLRDICAKVGEDAEALLAAARTDPVKQKLWDNGDELMARGGFGVPTVFLNGDDMYWGSDRLPLIEHAITRIRAARGAAL